MAVQSSEEILAAHQEVVDRQLALSSAAGSVSGFVRGLLAGHCDALRRLLERRFGPLSASQEERIAQAKTIGQVHRWIDRVLDATSIDDVLA